MNDAKIFLSIKVEGSGLIPSLGNVCLAPVRYFFHGRTIRVIPKKDAFQEVHHVLV